MSTRAKPSDIHNDESGELLKKRAEAANRKRRERQEELKRKENIRQREEFRKAKAEQEAKEREENEERVRKAAEEAAKKTKETKEAKEAEEAKKTKETKEAKETKETKEAKEKKKEPNKSQLGKKIKTEVDGQSFDSLAKAMAWIDPVNWGKENAYRTSCWIKINRALKRDGECEFGGHKYRMI